jgi:transketolase
VGISPSKFQDLEEVSYQVRRLSLEMITYGGWGHLGGSFSMAEIMAVLYFHTLRVNPALPDWEERDRLVLSKAHAAPALYAALALKGFFSVEDLYTYCQLGGIEGHLDMIRSKGLESSGGALGLGLSISVGMAIGLRMKEIYKSRVFCIIGDGETNEGNIWEAAMSAAHYHLDNLIAILDYNKVMAKGFVWDEMNIEPVSDKWKAFGWDVVEIDGHNINEIADTLYRARWVMPRGKPILVVAHTVKGRGVEDAEFNYKWHTQHPRPEVADQMLRELSRRYGKEERGYSRLGDR